MLHLHLLGGLTLTRDDKPVTGFVSAKAQALFCYLVLNSRQTHLRSSLAALFWGEMPDEDAAINLRQAIANLKRLLEPYLDITRHTLAFNRDSAYWLDVEQFEAGGDIRLYHGELLKGFAVKDAPEFENWLTVERERLHEVAMGRYVAVATEQAATGDAAGALATWTRVLALDPLREDAHRQVMLAYAHSGQRAAALAQFDQCAAILDRELDVAPAPETFRLYERIKSAQPIASLPYETTGFVGRGSELSQIARRLHNPACRLITVVGMGGCGKTRLVVHAAHHAAGQFLHGACFVDLTAATSAPAMLVALASGVGLNLGSGDPRRQLLAFLREKHLLLVLDNCEHLISAVASMVSELLRTAPDLTVLATSRERLNVQGEWLLPLEGLAYAPPAASPDDLAADDETAAVQLFWQAANRVRGDAPTTDADRAAARRICQIVEGLPLGIELAAAWTRLLSCQELVDEIERNLPGLAVATHDVEERHLSLRAVLDHSWQLLAPQERQMMSRLAIFRAGFSREAAKVVADAALPPLLALVDKSLLRRVADGRFSLHEVTRQFIIQTADYPAVEAEAHAAHHRYYATFLQQHSGQLRSQQQPHTVRHISAEAENLWLAWGHAVETADWERVSIMLEPLSQFFDMRAWYFLGADAFEQATLGAAAAAVDTAADSAAASVTRLNPQPSLQRLHAQLLVHRALFLMRLDRLEEAWQAAEQALTQLEDARNRALALAVCGNVRLRQDRLPEARPYFEQSYQLRTAADDPWGMTDSLLNLSSLAWRENRASESKRLAEQGLAISQEHGDLWTAARFQTALAILASEQGQYAQARQLHADSLRLYEQLGVAQEQSHALNGLGVVAYLEGNYPEARDYFVSCAALERQIGGRFYLSNTLANLGEVYTLMHEPRLARRHFQEALEIATEIGHEQVIAAATEALAKTD